MSYIETYKALQRRYYEEVTTPGAIALTCAEENAALTIEAETGKQCDVGSEEFAEVAVKSFETLTSAPDWEENYR